MFTGLIQGLGEIVKIERFRGGRKISVKWDGFGDNRLKFGASVSIDGVCLSVENVADDIADFVAVEETIERTTLKYREDNDLVNIELPMTPQSFLDGHIVQGHIDCVAEIVDFRQTGAQYLLRIKYDKKFSKYVVEKGSIAIDGISLTVAKCGGTYFECAIIPETMKRTNLSHKRTGDLVNLEFDIIAKYIDKLLDDKTESDNYDDFAANY